MGQADFVASRASHHSSASDTLEIGTRHYHFHVEKEAGSEYPSLMVCKKNRKWIEFFIIGVQNKPEVYFLFAPGWFHPAVNFLVTSGLGFNSEVKF